MAGKTTPQIRHHWHAEQIKGQWVFTHPLADLFPDNEKFPTKIKVPSVLYIEEDTAGVPVRRLKLGQPESAVNYWCAYSLPTSEQGDDIRLIETHHHIAGGHSPYHAFENALRNIGEYSANTYFLVRAVDNKIDGTGFVIDVYDNDLKRPVERLAWGATTDDVIDQAFAILDKRRTARELERQKTQAAPVQHLNAA